MMRALLALLLLLATAGDVVAQSTLPAGRYPAVVTIAADGQVTYTVQATVQVPIYTLEIIVSGSGCTPTPNAGSHVYQADSVVPLAATCSGSFVSWTGDTGCAGGQSHSITMNGNKRCTLTATP
jgi:hypothetical protein